MFHTSLSSLIDLNTFLQAPLILAPSAIDYSKQWHGSFDLVLPTPKKMRKSNIRNSRSMKISVIFWAHLVYTCYEGILKFIFVNNNKCSFVSFSSYSTHSDFEKHQNRNDNQITVKESFFLWLIYKHNYTEIYFE